MSNIEIFYLYVINRAFHIFICKKNPASNGEVHVIEVLDSGHQLVHRGNLGVLTGTSQGIYLLLCEFVANEPHTLAEKYYLRNEINASMEQLAKIEMDLFLPDFINHSVAFQEQAYKIIKQYEPSAAAAIEEMVDVHWRKKVA